MFFPNMNKLTSLPEDAELALKSGGKLWPIDADLLISPVRDFDEVGAVMLCRVRNPRSNASLLPGSALVGVTVGGENIGSPCSGTYRPLGFVVSDSNDPLERTTVFQKIAE